jgi:hypothetical protein
VDSFIESATLSLFPFLLRQAYIVPPRNSNPSDATPSGQVGLRPLERALALLRHHFGHAARFFVDALGNDAAVLVAWRPEALAPQPFKVMDSLYRRPLAPAGAAKAKAASAADGGGGGSGRDGDGSDGDGSDGDGSGSDGEASGVEPSGGGESGGEEDEEDAALRALSAGGARVSLQRRKGQGGAGGGAGAGASEGLMAVPDVPAMLRAMCALSGGILERPSEL